MGSKWIGLDFSCIYNKDPIVDPSKFDLNPIGYVIHLKNHFVLESIN